MDDSGSIRDDLKLPEGDVGKDIREKYDKDESGILVRDIS